MKKISFFASVFLFSSSAFATCSLPAGKSIESSNLASEPSGSKILLEEGWSLQKPKYCGINYVNGSLVTYDCSVAFCTAGDTFTSANNKVWYESQLKKIGYMTGKSGALINPVAYSAEMMEKYKTASAAEKIAGIGLMFGGYLIGTAGILAVDVGGIGVAGALGAGAAAVTAGVFMGVVGAGFLAYGFGSSTTVPQVKDSATLPSTVKNASSPSSSAYYTSKSDGGINVTLVNSSNIPTKVLEVDGQTLKNYVTANPYFASAVTSTPVIYDNIGGYAEAVKGGSTVSDVVSYETTSTGSTNFQTSSGKTYTMSSGGGSVSDYTGSTDSFKPVPVSDSSASGTTSTGTTSGTASSGTTSTTSSSSSTNLDNQPTSAPAGTTTTTTDDNLLAGGFGDITGISNFLDSASLDGLSTQYSTTLSNLQTNYNSITSSYDNAYTLISTGFDPSSLNVPTGSCASQSFNMFGQQINLFEPDFIGIFYPVGYILGFIALSLATFRMAIKSFSVGV